MSLQRELCACGLEECRVMIGLICLLACEKSEKAAGLRIGESKKIFMRHIIIAQISCVKALRVTVSLLWMGLAGAPNKVSTKFY